jgi:hypothetical protein
MTSIDLAQWRQKLHALQHSNVSAVLIVQCSVDWLRPPADELRDDVDRAVMATVLARDDITVDRLVLHNVPHTDAVPPGELATLNTAHRDWLYRLAATQILLQPHRRLHIHRLIIESGQRSVNLTDMIELRRRRTWRRTRASSAARHALRRPGATTRLTGYDVDLDGPFGDADPSVYL